ncbi:MAG: arylesterase, partial [Alphaproteobacteria bacterium]|nr:arylesterase [Alphaproteobacteria bacterium]
MRAFARTISALLIAFSLGLIPLYGAAAAKDEAEAPKDPLTIFALGDSLMAGYELPPGVSVPALLEEKLREDGYCVNVINAGVSGDISESGRNRLGWTLAGLEDQPDLAIVELGANDALRGIDPATTKANLAAIIEDLQSRGIPVLLAGMMAPPNMGPSYAERFNALFPALAEEYGTALYPFFLDGVATSPELKLDDGLHPNPEGVKVIVTR